MLGHPVAHSLSPAMHRAAYVELGLDWSFEALDVDVDGLAAFVAWAGSEPGPGPAWRGLALTMPLKRAVLGLLDSADDAVRTVGAANTLLWEPDGTRRGANTDVPGLVDALRAAGSNSGSIPGSISGSISGPVTVLGGGATAASAVAALAMLGAGEVEVRVREPARAAELLPVAGRVGVVLRVVELSSRWSEPAGVLVSTVPAGAALATLPGSGWLRTRAPQPAVVLDAVYDPWPSVLLERAAAMGARTVSGVDLLAYQARSQLRLMCGRDVRVETLLAVAHAALSDRLGRRTGYAE